VELISIDVVFSDNRGIGKPCVTRVPNKGEEILFFGSLIEESYLVTRVQHRSFLTQPDEGKPVATIWVKPNEVTRTDE
jgi:hypothetical protein